MENEIWLAKIEQTNFEDSKIRPILIISKNNYNKKYEDVIGFWITTNIDHDFSLPINKKYIEEGKLFDKSAVRCDGIIKINKQLLRKKILKIKPMLKKDVLKKFNELIC